MDNPYQFLKFVKEYCWKKKIDAYLVGGAVRNLLLKKEIQDFDIVLNGPVKNTACFFADRYRGSLVSLDDEREIYRVVLKNISFDFTGIKGDTIEKDLQKRDFTVNALALPIQQLKFPLSNKKLTSRDIIDPTGGYHHLQERLLQAVYPEAFFDDPLRLWRAFRFKVHYNLEITDETEKLIRQSISLAAVPAPERIHDELVKIFKADAVSETIREMENKYLLFSQIIPAVNKLKESGKNRYHRENAWEHCLQVLEFMEILLGEKNFEVNWDFTKEKHGYFSGMLKSNKLKDSLEKKNFYLLKIAALFHDIGKSKCCQHKDDGVHYYGHDREGAVYFKKVLKRIKFSSKEISYITGLIKFHMRPLLLYLADNLTIRGKLRFFNEADKLTVPILFLSTADKSSNMLYNKREEELKDYLDFINELFLLYNSSKEKMEKNFISGREVMELTGVKEGPMIGKILKRIKNEQALGNIKSREEALSYLKNHYQK